MDKYIIIFIIFLTVFIKIAYIDNYCYEKLRDKHSKSYIKKTYKGLINKIFYKDFIKEVGLLLSILNFLILLMIAVLTIVLIVSFFAEIKHLLNSIIVIYFLFAVLYSFILLFNFVIMNKNCKGEKSSTFSRIFIALLFCLIFILYFINK